MRIFYILCLTLLATVQAKSQSQQAFQKDAEAKHVKFYPNPATSLITFDVSKDNEKEVYSFQIFNFLGKKIYESSNLSSRTIVSLTDFTRGIYIFQLKDQTGRIIESDKFQVLK